MIITSENLANYVMTNEEKLENQIDVFCKQIIQNGFSELDATNYETSNSRETICAHITSALMNMQGKLLSLSY